MLRFSILWVVLLVLPACRKDAPKASRGERACVLPTLTDPVLATSNFEARISGLEQLLVRNARDPRPDFSRAPELVEQLLSRAQLFGRLKDYDAAEAWVARLVPSRALPTPPLLVMRARVSAAMHRFTDALSDLDVAQKTEGYSRTVRPLRKAIFQAQGKLSEAAALEDGDKPQGILALGGHAVLLAEQGRTEEADRAFAAALQGYEDVSPIPIAWLYFQWGLTKERAGDWSEAGKLYSVAHQVFPQYAPAAGHLAQYLALQGNQGAAKALVEPLLAQSDDPEYRAQLASLIEKTDAPRAARLRQEAAESYASLVQRHPDAFADHAARFFLNTAPLKALQLAQRNLLVRQTADSYELVMDAALAAGRHDDACRVATQVLSSRRPGERITLRAERVRKDC